MKTLLFFFRTFCWAVSIAALSSVYVLGQYHAGMETYENNLKKVQQARQRYENRLRQSFAAKGLNYPAYQVFLRGFKQEKKLELWARSNPADSFRLFQSYSVCKISGELGPKKRAGDGQTPEGFYKIDVFNGDSPANYMGLRIDFPSAADARHGDLNQMGGNIYIHGGCASIGCLAMTDTTIQQIYLVCLDALLAYGQPLAVHLFPTALTDKGLETICTRYPANRSFWQELQKGYLWFETRKRLPNIRWDAATQKLVFEN